MLSGLAVPAAQSSKVWVRRVVPYLVGEMTGLRGKGEGQGLKRTKKKFQTAHVLEYSASRGSP